jgi:hypothetical protein
VVEWPSYRDSTEFLAKVLWVEGSDKPIPRRLPHLSNAPPLQVLTPVWAILFGLCVTQSVVIRVWL